MMAAVALLVLSGTQDQCVDEMLAAIGRALETEACAGITPQSVLEEEVSFFIQGKRSLLGEWIEYLDRQGKLDAVLERARRRAAFVSSEGYGKTRWGWTESRVRKVYPKAKPGQGSLIVEDTKTAGMPSIIVFIFPTGKLAQVKIGFARDHSPLNPEGPVRDFHAVEKLLTTKYGAARYPQGVDVPPIDQMYEDVGGTGRAVRAGRTQLVTERAGVRTTILHHLKRADGGSVLHYLEYTSTELAGLLETAEKGQVLEGL